MILKPKKLDSSQIDVIQYDPENNILIVKFQDRILKSGIKKLGKSYKYLNVPLEIYETIISAKTNPEFEFSHGKCFHKLIKLNEDKYPPIPLN